MTLEELEKQNKEFGAALVSLKEELKLVQDSSKADPKQVQTLQDEIASLKSSWEEFKSKFSTPDPKPKPALEPRKRGFGFF